MKLQKRLAASVLGCSTKRVLFDETKLNDIKEAITKADIRRLISQGSIIEVPKRGISRARANKRKVQRSKGRQTSHGSRKGRAGARGETRKREWISRARLQRRFIKSLKQHNKIDHKVYRELYRKVKGGFFRNKRHVSLYLEERGIVKNEK